MEDIGNCGEDFVYPFDDVVMETSPQMAETWKRMSLVHDASSPQLALQKRPTVDGILLKAGNKIIEKIATIC